MGWPYLASTAAYERRSSAPPLSASFIAIALLTAPTSAVTTNTLPMVEWTAAQGDDGGDSRAPPRRAVAVVSACLRGPSPLAGVDAGDITTRA